MTYGSCDVHSAQPLSVNVNFDKRIYWSEEFQMGSLEAQSKSYHSDIDIVTECQKHLDEQPPKDYVEKIDPGPHKF